MGKHSTWNATAWRLLANRPDRKELWLDVADLRDEGLTPELAVQAACYFADHEDDLVNVCDGEDFVCSDTEPHTHYQPVVPEPEAISQVVNVDEPAKVGRRSQFARHPVTGKFVTKEEQEALESLHELSLL